MENDEQAIRGLVDAWIEASKAGDLAGVLKLTSDDVIFMVPGQEPFGKDVFVARFGQMKNVQFKAASHIQEIKILGEWAWTRNRLNITITPPGERPVSRFGYTLTILHKEPDGRWVIYRDANLIS